MNFSDLIHSLVSLNNNYAKYFLDGQRPIVSIDSATEIAEQIEGLMFPSFFTHSYESEKGLEHRAEELFRILVKTLSPLLEEGDSRWAEHMAEDILQDIPSVKQMLIKDAIAIFRGDPAACSVDEILLCYPGFFAVMSYRIARLFYLRKIPYIPRIITERAHRLTGIDIHPGAAIGESLCIDHGTGVVIGETAIIGNRVKIYQGVTIGAKSFEPDGTGGLIKGKKRHPNIGDDCIIYAGATILGGDTVIGNGCIIGGNVWLTHSVSPGSRVYYNEK